MRQQRTNKTAHICSAFTQSKNRRYCNKKNNKDESKERKKNHLYICVCVDRNEYLQTSFCFCFNKNVRMDIIIRTKRNKTNRHISELKPSWMALATINSNMSLYHSVLFCSLLGIVAVSNESQRTFLFQFSCNSPIVMYLFKLFWSLSASSTSFEYETFIHRYLFALATKQLFKYYFRFIYSYINTIWCVAFISAFKSLINYSWNHSVGCSKEIRLNHLCACLFAYIHMSLCIFVFINFIFRLCESLIFENCHNKTWLDSRIERMQRKWHF